VSAERPLKLVEGVLKQWPARGSTRVVHKDVYVTHIRYGPPNGAQILKVQGESLVPVSMHFCN
jgi:hypothetical protein